MLAACPPPVHDPSSSATALLGRAEALFDSGGHEEGERVARAALGAAAAASDAEGQHAAWDLISRHADRLGRMAVAASAAEEALALLPVAASAPRARLHCRLARIFATLDLDAANLRHATAALAAARDCGDTELICLGLSRLGAARASSGDWRSAATLVEQALSLARAEGNETEIFRGLNNLGAILYYLSLDAARRDEPRESRDAAREGLRWADEALVHPCAVADPYRSLIVHANRNLLLIQDDRAGEGLAGCIESLALAGRHGYAEIVGHLDQARGKAMAMLGDPVGGAAVLEATLAAITDGGVSIRARLHEDLYLVHKSAGDPARALVHHEALLALERGRSRGRADAEYDVLLERAEMQRTRLDAERAQREADLQRLLALRLRDERDVMEARATEMGRHAFEDVLTGLPNRRAIDAHLEAMLAEAGGAHGTISIGIIDIDHFKVVNDTFGHGIGDDVIRAVGALLSAGLRDGDVVGRIGGEEFVLVLAHTAIDAAAVTGERLRLAIEDHAWSGLKPGLAVTASIGLCFVDRVCPARIVFEQADAAMYAAKAAGRNRVVVDRVACVQRDHDVRA